MEAALARLEAVESGANGGVWREIRPALAHVRHLLGREDGGALAATPTADSAPRLGIPWHDPAAIETVLGGAWWPGRDAERRR